MDVVQFPKHHARQNSTKMINSIVVDLTNHLNNPLLIELCPFICPRSLASDTLMLYRAFVSGLIVSFRNLLENRTLINERETLKFLDNLKSKKKYFKYAYTSDAGDVITLSYQREGNDFCITSITCGVANAWEIMALHMVKSVKQNFLCFDEMLNFYHSKEFIKLYIK